MLFLLFGTPCALEEDPLLVHSNVVHIIYKDIPTNRYFLHESNTGMRKICIFVNEVHLGPGIKDRQKLQVVKIMQENAKPLVSFTMNATKKKIPSRIL